IGKETAIYLAQQGYVVYGIARRVEKLNELNARGVLTIPADITDEKSTIHAVETIIRKTGKIDVLINNAGYGEYGAFEDVSIENAKKQLEVNLFGLARITQLIIPHMRSQQSGKIINISSTGGKMAAPLGGWYHASKFALEGLSDTMRMELKPFGIDVIVV